MRRAAIDRTLLLSGALAAGAALALPCGSQAIATPPAPKPPLAYPGYVEQVTASSATLKGSVNPRGSATAYYFQYGPTTAYGSQTPQAPVGSGTQEVKVTQAIAGLLPYTTYHYRVVASSSAGTTDSPDATFTTKKIPLSLTAAAAPDPVVFGSPLSLSGTLSGTGSAGAEIVLQANPFPYSEGFHNATSPERTDAAGGFSFALAGLLESTHLRVATVSPPTIYSPVVAELVTVRVALHVRATARRGHVRFYGTITPAKPGARIALEQFQHGRYVLVGGTKVRRRDGGGARFGLTKRLRSRGRYRVLVEVAYGGVISGRSRPVLIR
jgi:hypothetical protein